MRWTNYFLHPADNRYYVFSFKEEAYADIYESSLKEFKIPFERYEDEEIEFGEKYLFGVPRTHFKEALNQNHLLYAQIRKPFIPSRPLKWSVLLITGLALALALFGALTQKVYGQKIESKSGWEIAVQSRLNTPFKFAGVEKQTFSELGLISEWTPLIAQNFGVRLQYRFRDKWTIGTGILWLRRNFSVQIQYQNDTLGIMFNDTLPLLRSVGYRIPTIAETRIPLGRGYFITAAGGIAIELSPSDVFVNGSSQNGGTLRDFEAYLGRISWASIPIIAELGLEKMPKKKAFGWYIGTYWSQTLKDALWIEHVWQSDDVRIVGRGFLQSTLAGLEFRLLLK